MDRSEGPNIAVGALLLGVTTVIVAVVVSRHIAEIAAVVCFIAGAYLIASVYTGWPSLLTAQARVFRPRLTNARAEVRQGSQNVYILLVRVDNTGRDNLVDADVNLVVPEIVESMWRCDRNGNNLPIGEAGQLHIEDERFWAGNETFSGRMTKLMFFKTYIPGADDFSARLKIIAPALDDPLETEVSFVFPAEGS
jgi:hypothetical protein